MADEPPHSLTRTRTRLERHIQQLGEARAQQILKVRERAALARAAREEELAEAYARYESRRVRRVEDLDGFEDEGVRQLGDAVRPHDGPSWGAIAAGFALIAVIGITGVIVYLLVRRKSDGTLGEVVQHHAPLAAAPQVYLINAGGGQSSVVRAAPVEVATSAAYDDSNTLSALSRIESQLQANNSRAQRIPTSAMLKTYRLPWLGDSSNNSQAVRVATSLDNPYEVVVRVVGPAGGLAALSFSQTELGNQRVIGPGLSMVPTGDVVIIPAGQQPQTIRMNPRQVLFARGNLGPANPTGAVVLSIAATDSYDAR